jgi:hypothetical protein
LADCGVFRRSKVDGHRFARLGIPEVAPDAVASLPG